MPTYGVAVTIPAPFGEFLTAVRVAAGDPLGTAIPPHVTLLPPTDIPDAALPDFAAHLAGVAARHPAFEMQLCGTGTFRPVSPVVFVQVAAGSANCEGLERAVRSGPVARALDFPYHPHVTVAHNVPDPRLDAAHAALAQFHAGFTVDGIDLYEQGADSVWRPQQRFTLATSAG